MSLRVGSLDALMTLSDDLSKVNITVESVVNKIRRQACELAPDQALQVNGRPTVSYLTSFTWDEAKYPLRKPLKDLVNDLTEVVVSVDDEMKVRSTRSFALVSGFPGMLHTADPCVPLIM
jgi:V-type H+-transporting ATPase subunit C